MVVLLLLVMSVLAFVLESQLTLLEPYLGKLFLFTTDHLFLELFLLSVLLNLKQAFHSLLALDLKLFNVELGSDCTVPLGNFN